MPTKQEILAHIEARLKAEVIRQNENSIEGQFSHAVDMEFDALAAVAFAAAVSHTAYAEADAVARDRFAALEAFKAYVHKRLDDAGIPTRPDGPHSKEGCRVGDRLDIALSDAVIITSMEVVDGQRQVLGYSMPPDGIEGRWEGWTRAKYQAPL